MQRLASAKGAARSPAPLQQVFRAASGRAVQLQVRCHAGLPDRFDLRGKTIAVNGCSRGIGEEFVRQLLERSNKVIASVRNPDKAQNLLNLKSQHPDKLHIVACDVADTGSVNAWAGQVAELSPEVNVLLNCAGVREFAGIEDVTPTQMLDSYRVNAMGPIFTVQQLLKHKLLRSGSLVANVTSLVASIAENGGGSNYPYRCSKIAANMATKSMSVDLEPHGITCTILHPGYVRTEMTGGQGFLDPEESVVGMLKVLESGVSLNGEWYHSDGRHLPW